MIYDDALGAGWSNWSWGVTLRLDERASPQQGRQAIAVTYQHAWAGLKLHHRAGVSTNRFTRLRFWVHGGTRGGQQLQVYLLNGNAWMSPLVRLPPLPAGRWSLVEIPLARFGSPPRVTDLILHERNGPHRDTFFVDTISLTP